MAKIKWAGVIDDVSPFQKGELSPHAQKLDMPATMGGMMVKAAPFLIVPTMLVVVSMFLKTYFSGEVVVSFPFLLMGLGAGLLLSPVHECLHAAVYPKKAVVHIGIVPKCLAAVALCSYPLSKTRFVVMCLLPSVLGIAPIVLFWLLPPECRAWNGFLFGTAVFGLVSPYPDLYNVFQVCKQAPPGCEIQFYGDDVYSIAPAHGS